MEPVLTTCGINYRFVSQKNDHFFEFFPENFPIFFGKKMIFFQQKNRKILIVFHCFCTFLCEFWFCLAYLSIFLKKLGEKNVDFIVFVNIVMFHA